MNDDRPPSQDRSSYVTNQNPDFPPGYSLHSRRSYDASPYFSPQAATVPSSYFNLQPHSSTRASIGSNSEYSSSFSQNYQSTQESRRSTLPNYSTPSYNFPSQLQQQPPPLQPPAQAPYIQSPQPPSLSHLDTKMGRRRKSEEVDADDAEYNPDGPASAAGGRSAKRARRTDAPPMATIPSEESHALPPAPHMAHFAGVEVKTRFPVARIKRIMQADEDVGKLAMAAPIAVAKALELFMVSLVTRAATEAREKNSKRVTAIHLKQAVQKDTQFDFLEELIQKVSDQPEAKSKTNNRGRSESVEPAEDEEASGKKKKGVGGGASRRRAAEGDDD
ncbi:MAG: hypothetical protein Q9227_004333 [Pyrenula ochraceoflavens]